MKSVIIKVMLKKLWKIVKVIIIASVAVYLLSLAIVISIGQYHRPIQKADAIIVLGAAINTPALYNRSLEGLRLYQEGKADVLVLSGGVDYPKSIPEAQYMENVILAAVNQEANHPSPALPVKGREDIKEPTIILENTSQSTLENIANSKKLIPNARSVIIVSDTYHLARGVITAKAAGFSPVFWSSPDSGSYYFWDEFFYY